ncbi:PhoH family protein [Elusimicrobiota bacterium]
MVKKIVIENTDQALIILGKEDSNLREIEKKFKVNVFVKRDSASGSLSIVLKGSKARIEKAITYLQATVEDYPHPIRPPQEERSDEEQEQDALPQVADGNVICRTTTGRAIFPKTENQRQYIEALKTNDLVVAIGPAGTGKTYLAVAYAIKCLKDKDVARIVLTRPVVEAGEKLGFLPGDLYEKIYPYLKPLYDAFYSMLGPEKFKSLQVTETIDIVPLAYMRGRTLEDAFIILDEAQNTTPTQMKMFLTRMGKGSKIVVTGDVTQVDLEDKQSSALCMLEGIVGNVPRVKFVYTSEVDVARHDLVKGLLKAYDKWEAGKAKSH